MPLFGFYVYCTYLGMFAVYLSVCLNNCLIVIQVSVEWTVHDFCVVVQFNVFWC